MPGPLRKERTHQTGVSNRTFNSNPDGPLDFDHDARSYAPREWTYKMPTQVPLAKGFDFDQELQGFLLRFPKKGGKLKALSDTSKDKSGSKEKIDGKPATTDSKKEDVPTIKAPPRATSGKRGEKVEPLDNVRMVPRWKWRHWWEAPTVLQHPLKKEDGETWNAHDSLKPKSERKGQDHLLRSMRMRKELEEIEEDPERVEYYPDRNNIDAVDLGPSNDWQIRPDFLPEFANKIPDTERASKTRVSRIREVLRLRYAGRPALINVFRNYSLTKQGYVFPEDLNLVLEQMGVKATLGECKQLIAQVDTNDKGAMTFTEFADFVYSPPHIVTAGAKEAKDRIFATQTKNLIEGLLQHTPYIGNAFCEVDQERNYLISKSQFANAMSSAVNHLTSEAIDYLWAMEFHDAPANDQTPDKIATGMIDWRSFMHRLDYFANQHRQPTPCTLQGRKSNYDMLQKTAILTDGQLPPVNLSRPENDPENEVVLVADKIVHKEKQLAHLPAKVAFLTPKFVDDIQTKCSRAQRALQELLPRDRVEQLVNRKMTRSELVDIIMEGIEEKKDILSEYNTVSTIASGPAVTKKGTTLPAYLRIERADVEAFVSCERANADEKVERTQLIESIFHEKLPMEELNDALNRTLRLHPPERQREEHSKENPRYGNIWQARYAMETIYDELERKEVSNGGKLKIYKIFKRLDDDNDGYITLQDMQLAFEKLKIQLQADDAHALLTHLDPNDVGAIDLPSFAKTFELHQGTFIDGMQKPVRGVFRCGGAIFGGPVQDRIREEDAKIEAREAEQRREMNQAYEEQARTKNSVSPGGGEAHADADAGADACVGSGAVAGQNSTGIPQPGTPTGSQPNNDDVIQEGALKVDDTIVQPSERSVGISEPMTPYSVTSSMRDPNVYRVSDVIISRSNKWKVRKHAPLPLPPGRFSRTLYPDTRHITQPMDPRSGSFLHDLQRFQTTSLSCNILAKPDAISPQVMDALNKNATREFRVERIRNRRIEQQMKIEAMDEFQRDYDERRIARKALQKLNYERRVRLACCFD